MFKDDYYSVQQLATYMGVTRQTVSRWLRQGIITSIKIGTTKFISKDCIDSMKCPLCGSFHREFTKGE